MKFGTPKEVIEGENRVGMTPDSAKQLQKLGYDCLIESGAGPRQAFPTLFMKAQASLLSRRRLDCGKTPTLLPRYVSPKWPSSST